MFKIITLILITLLSMSTAFAADNAVDKKIGQVVALRGRVTAEQPDGNSRPLAIKSPLYRNDTIITERRGRIQMLFNDSTIISLGRSTKMTLAEYAWDDQKKTGAMTTDVKQGTFRVMGGAITKYSPKTFKTVTPSATIGIRGSMYSGNVNGSVLTVVFQGGTGIDITNGAGTVAISTPGFGTHVDGPQQEPNEPILFSAAEIDDINGGMANGNEQDSTPQDTDSSQGGDAQDGDNESPPADQSAPLTDNTSQEDEPLAPPLPPADNPLTDTTALIDSVTETVDTASRPLENVGAAPTTLPTDGISGYKGVISGTDGSGAPISGTSFMEVNWKNRKVFGIMEESTGPNGTPVLFFGSINGTTLSNVRIFGSQASGMGVSALDGSGDGLFYGQGFTQFTLDALGKEYDLTDAATAILGDWSANASLTKETIQDPVDKISPSGSELWQGFFVGISEDVNNIDLDRKRFANDTDTDFSFTVNKDLGTISGSMSGIDLGFPSQTGFGSISSIQIGEAGGVGNSAYILDDSFAAILECSSGNCIDDSDLKAHGNFLFTSNPDDQFSPWATWGYWEAAYQSSATQQYHAHIPGTLWLAGVKTPAAAVANLISTSFVGNYNGMARGTMFDNLQNPDQFQELNGSSQFTIKFGDSITPITGTLDFGTAGIYNITGTAGSLSSTGFSANVDGAATPVFRTNPIEGNFYGSNAQAIGGNFAFDVGDKAFTGIFGASR